MQDTGNENWSVGYRGHTRKTEGVGVPSNPLAYGPSPRYLRQNLLRRYRISNASRYGSHGRSAHPVLYAQDLLVCGTEVSVACESHRQRSSTYHIVHIDAAATIEPGSLKLVTTFAVTAGSCVRHKAVQNARARGGCSARSAHGSTQAHQIRGITDGWVAIEVGNFRRCDGTQ